MLSADKAKLTEVLDKIRALRKESEQKREMMMGKAREWQIRTSKARNRVSNQDLQECGLSISLYLFGSG